MENRGFKGIWIPAEIWLNKDLTVMEKLFLVEIDSLDNKNGCFASNAHFSDMFSVSKGRCTQIIKSLEEKKLILITYEKEGKLIKKRIIRVFNKLNRGVKNNKQGCLENDEGNNTSNNNTDINNISSFRFDEFWNVFADNRGKDGAEKVWKRKKLDNIADDVIKGALKYVETRGVDKRYWKQAQGWLNDGRWKDDPIVITDSATKQESKGISDRRLN